jgi:hypothetical protein
MTTHTPEYRDKAFPFKEMELRGTHFKYTDLLEWPLIDVLNSIKRWANIWINTDGKAIREWINAYNKELLPWMLVIAFDRDEARMFQVEASKMLEWKDTWKYTLPDITTFFEIEKDGKTLYCYVVDRMDMWKHKKDMLMWEIDNISIDWMIVYPSWLVRADWEIIQVRDDVSGILSTGKNF